MADNSMKITVDAGGKNIKLGGKTVLKGIAYSVTATNRELKEGGEKIIVKDPEKIGGEDLAGKYRGVVRSLCWEMIDRRGRHWDMDHAYLETRIYDDVFAIRARCDVSASLASENHFRVEVEELPGMKNLLALWHHSDWWTRPHFDTDLAKLPRSSMLLWQIEDGTYGCLLALSHGGCRSQFTGRTGKLGVDLLLYDGNHAKSDAYACIGGFGDDPHELVKRCVVRGMDIAGRPGKLRWEKPYPSIFENIGWCTWDAFYDQVNEKGILKKMQEMQKAEFPFRYVLIDDGWSPTKERQLAGFDTDKEKFPRGLRPLVEDLRCKYGIDQVGVWHTFTGYWRGIHPDTDVYKLNREHILDNKRGGHIPYPEAAKSFGFWNAWHSQLRNEGISFVKVDNQGATFHHSQGSLPIGDAARGQQYGLQSSIGLNFNNQVINCMCMLPENAWHWVSSNISRNSDDFAPKSEQQHAEHARQNVYASLLYGNFSWPDWDMWWSTHPAAKYHAAMRAISGGPVYVSDKVDESDFDVLRPLILTGGRLLRCDSPAMPTRDILFADPKTNPVALKAYNTVGSAGMLIALNATDDAPTVKGQIKPSDVVGIQGKLFAAREYFTGETKLLKKDEAWSFELEPYGVRLFSIVPIVDGVAVIGLANKYVSLATVVHTSLLADSLLVTLAEGGELVVYSDKSVKRVMSGGKQVKFKQDGGWIAAQVAGSGSVDIVIEW